MSLISVASKKACYSRRLVAQWLPTCLHLNELHEHKLSFMGAQVRLDANFSRLLEHRLACRPPTSSPHFPRPKCERPAVPFEAQRSVARKSGKLCNAPGPPTLDVAEQRTTRRHAGGKRNSSSNHCGERIRPGLRQSRFLQTLPSSHLLCQYWPPQAAAPPRTPELVVDVHRPHQNQL
jgi:hypothetical protein